jgi:hypothetical protein
VYRAAVARGAVALYSLRNSSPQNAPEDDLRPEYDLSQLKGGVRWTAPRRPRYMGSLRVPIEGDSLPCERCQLDTDVVTAPLEVAVAQWHC